MFTAYGSHLPVLVALARRSVVRMAVEIGSGEHSTVAFLRRRLFPDLVRLHSVEDHPVWAHTMKSLVLDERWIFHDRPSGVMVAAVEADLVLVDNDPYLERISALNLLFALGVKQVVLHDRESYYYDEACSHWPYASVYSTAPGMPDTAILSKIPHARLTEAELSGALSSLRDEVFP